MGRPYLLCVAHLELLEHARPGSRVVITGDSRYTGEWLKLDPENDGSLDYWRNFHRPRGDGAWCHMTRGIVVHFWRLANGAHTLSPLVPPTDG